MVKKSNSGSASFSEEDIERWGAEADGGLVGWEFGKSVAGRPISVGSHARPFTLRLDAERRSKLTEIAKRRQITTSQLMRDLIDTLE
ncbi:hypothetical protein ACIFOC_00028 [Leucobacter aridicollis]|uniref:CopG family transcriptional regulator n=1 Tax=Leucobacter aridicollis TaxID=283878 RepID=UPI0021688E8F|nr:CopG family transcriptional regulator [Leucobacter aridicollis]MCS3426384.1 putative transcriptional regulator [Leucobacter aridicollis]